MMNETQWYVEYNKSNLFVFLDLAVSSQCFCVCVCAWEGGLLRAEPHCHAITHCQSQQC